MNKNHKRWLVAVPLLLILLAAMAYSYRWGMSDIYYFQAKRLQAYWGEKDQAPTQQDVAEALRLIGKARNYYPQHPDYLYTQAQILAWQGFISDDVGPYQQAITLLRAAHRSRPAYAYSWLLLAEIKTRAGQKDAEWLEAKEKALEYGGFDIDIVKRVERLQ